MEEFPSKPSNPQLEGNIEKHENTGVFNDSLIFPQGEGFEGFEGNWHPVKHFIIFRYCPNC
jgi:hypothetical protein